MNMFRKTLKSAVSRAGNPGPATGGAGRLSALAAGASGSVVALVGGQALVARLAALGLTPGVSVHVAQNPGHGPVIVVVRDTRLVLGRGEAGGVLVVSSETDHAGEDA